MVIELSGIAKKFKTRIFDGIDLRFESPQSYCIIGRNGAGKSTFLKIISGYTTPTSGHLKYQKNGQILDTEEFPQKICFAAPYIGLIEELTVQEQVDFHRKFRNLASGMSTQDFLDVTNLISHRDKFVNQLSSGLMQRLKIALTVMTESEVVLLDEPTSYLDKVARGWFEKVFRQYCGKKLVIIATNDERDMMLCEHKINIEDWAAREF